MAPRLPTVDSLRATFRGGAEPARGDERLSGVLLPVVVDGDRLALLYEKRAHDLRAHAGEVCFPGGGVEPADASPLAAALREADEEVGLAPAEVEVIGHLTDYVTYRGAHVCAYVGLATRAEVGPLSREVAEAFLVPLEDLLDPDVYEGRAIETGEHLVHYFRVKPHTVWGITGELTARFLARACGWAPPRPPRVIHRMSDYLP